MSLVLKFYGFDEDNSIEQKIKNIFPEYYHDQISFEYIEDRLPVILKTAISGLVFRLDVFAILLPLIQPSDREQVMLDISSRIKECFVISINPGLVGDDKVKYSTEGRMVSSDLISLDAPISDYKET